MITLFPVFALFLGTFAEARPFITLDCNNPQNLVQKKICKQSVANTCAEAAVKGVIALEKARSGKDLEISRVDEIEEDASYKVSFVYNGQNATVLYSRLVYVSTSARDCRVSAIE
ncbi:MAG TPA: hypothetical protein VIH99_07480 [Bdellovibrionota bacterium]|jgi:hypothetical protein